MTTISESEVHITLLTDYLSTHKQWLNELLAEKEAALKKAGYSIKDTEVTGKGKELCDYYKALGRVEENDRFIALLPDIYKQIVTAAILKRQVKK